MNLTYRIVDVFAEEPFAGNPLAVFPDAPDIETSLMQRIAREMNLSETTFVTSAEPDRYSSRIFTPTSEMPFAGHPTLGTAWVLRDLGRLSSDEVVQTTQGGDTPVEFIDGVVWLRRSGTGGDDIEDVETLAKSFGIGAEDIGFDWETESGESVPLRPAIANPGLVQMMVPLASVKAVDELKTADFTQPEGTDGVYFFAQIGPGRVTARFFTPGLGVPEDPATGSAAAGLGLYLGARVGSSSITISQGRHIARPSVLRVQFDGPDVRVGGKVVPVASGLLTI